MEKNFNLEQHIGKLVLTLLISFIVGTVAMVYSSDKTTALLSQRIQFMHTNLTRIEDKLNEATNDRWTKSDQEIFTILIEDKIVNIKEDIKRIDARVDSLEQQKRR